MNNCAFLDSFSSICHDVEIVPFDICLRPSVGRVTVDNEELTSTQFRRISGLVTQEDVFEGSSFQCPDNFFMYLCFFLHLYLTDDQILSFFTVE